MSTRRTTTITTSGKGVNPEVFKYLLIGGIVIVVWYFFRHLRSRSSGSTSGAGAVPPLLKPLLPQQPKPGSGGGVGFGGGGPTGGMPSARGLSQALAGWVNNILTYGWRAAAQMPVYQDQSYLSGLGTDPSLSIPLEPMSLFDVGSLAEPIGFNGLDFPDVVDPSYTDQQIPYDQTSLFDVNSVAQDMPGYTSVDSSNTGIDPYYGADTLSLYNYDLSNMSIGGASSAFDGSYAIDPTSVGY